MAAATALHSTADKQRLRVQIFVTLSQLFYQLVSGETVEQGCAARLGNSMDTQHQSWWRQSSHLLCHGLAASRDDLSTSVGSC